MAGWYNTARVMRRTGGCLPAEYEQAGGTARSARSRPRAGQQAPPRHQEQEHKEAAMAAAHCPGGLRPPPGRRPGPRPS